jgi:IPT/TIG domain
VNVSGAASNAVPFSVPIIADITPNSGPVGALVTIDGSGFGASQGSGSVSINGTPMQVLSWDDSLILAAVATGTATGSINVQQGPIAISRPTFTMTSAFPYNGFTQPRARASVAFHPTDSGSFRTHRTQLVCRQAAVLRGPRQQLPDLHVFRRT